MSKAVLRNTRSCQGAAGGGGSQLKSLLLALELGNSQLWLFLIPSLKENAREGLTTHPYPPWPGQQDLPNRAPPHHHIVLAR